MFNSLLQSRNTCSRVQTHRMWLLHGSVYNSSHQVYSTEHFLACVRVFWCGFSKMVTCPKTNNMGNRVLVTDTSLFKLMRMNCSINQNSFFIPPTREHFEYKVHKEIRIKQCQSKIVKILLHTSF